MSFDAFADFNADAVMFISDCWQWCQGCRIACLRFPPQLSYRRYKIQKPICPRHSYIAALRFQLCDRRIKLRHDRVI